MTPRAELLRFSAIRRAIALLALVVLLAAACSSSDSAGEAASVADESADIASDNDAVEEDDADAEAGEDDAMDEEPMDEEPADDAMDDEPMDDDSMDDGSDDTPDTADAATSSMADDQEVDPTTLALAAETIGWTDCGARLQCGSIQVPADYDDDSLGTIRVSVNVLRSPDADERIGYLFINPGGPGQSGLEIVAAAELIGIPDELLNAFDLIGFDPRGVGLSEPEFACGVGSEQFDLLNQIEEDVDTDDEIVLGQQAAQLCIDSMGPVGARLHSEFVARDMDEIRKALGTEQISYLGFSYGSTLGGWYASLFPDNVYSMVVDGATNPVADADNLEEEIQLAREGIGPLHDQLANALDSCDSDACPIYNGGDPQAYWFDMVDKFELVSDAKGGNSQAILLGVIGHLYSETLWPDLHQATFDLAENDDPSGFITAIDNAGTVDEASVTQHINCLDRWALFPEETLEEILVENAELSDQIDDAISDDYPLLYAIDVPEQASSCPFYESIDPPVFTGTFDGGGIPILVIGNTSDPVTPFIKSEQYANDVLADGRLVKVEHPQHTVYPANNCIIEYVHAALIDREYPDDEPTCEAAEPVGLGPIELVEFSLPDGASSVRPAGWTEAGPGVYAQASSPLDPILLVFQPTGGDEEGTLGFIASQAGLEPELVGTIELDGTTWNLYGADLEAEDLSVRIAISAGPDGVMVLGQAFTADIDQLEEQVLQAAVENYQPAG